MTRILLISGSTRAESTNSAALKTVHVMKVSGIETVLYEDMMSLPHFNPDDDIDPLPEAVAALRTDIGRADALLFCTPEYAGALPGSFKNLLDWTVGGPEMDGRRVAWLTVAADGRGANATAELRTVLGYLGTSIVEDACRKAYVGRDAVGADGLVTDATFRDVAAEVLKALAE